MNDKLTWSIDRQFLWGSSLLINPVLDKVIGTFSKLDGDCNDNANVPFVSELRLEKTPCFPFEFASLESL